ncbi:MAG: IS1380 family transposase [Candidatus Binatia bacterium]
MRADCTSEQIEFQGLGRRKVVAGFDAGRATSDGGVMLLREVAERSGLLRDFAACFRDHRDPTRIEHTVENLVAQRVLGQALGYEDLNDHDWLRDDALLAVAVGKSDPIGAQRKRERDRGHALAAHATLNRLELTPAEADSSSRYQKIVYDEEAIENLFVEAFLRAHRRPPERIILDLDASDDPIHGEQEGRFFHGFYGSYCYLPLYIFCGDFLLLAKLRRSNIDASAGSRPELERIVGRIREEWPCVEIWIRADSGFAREEIMRWCEENRVQYVLGLARNSRLQAELAGHMAEAKQRHEESGRPERLFKDFGYRTRKTWSRRRRVVGKAEWLPGKENPRFVVTSLAVDTIGATELYEKIYCARGDMENRIKEQQLGLFADRTSSHTMRANQLRLFFASMAYVLVNELRRAGLAGTALAKAQVGTIRARLLKIGAVVRISIRRIYLALSSVFPLQDLFRQALVNLRAAYPLQI